MVDDKVVRIVFEKFNQFIAVCNDAFAIAPGNSGDKKTNDFYIFLFAELMRNLNGIGAYKFWILIVSGFFVQKFFEFTFFKFK